MAVRKNINLILKRYASMKGSKKVWLGMRLSKMARDVRKAGIEKMGV